MTNADKKPLLAILDGHGIIHRAYYALKDAPLVAKRTGENTSGVFGFTNTLLALLDDLKPTHLVVTMDLPGPTFRHIADATYKASRFENLKSQVLSSLANVAELNDDTRREMAESVVTATNRQQIQTEMRETAERFGVVGQTLNDIEEAMLPIQHAWDIGQQIQRCLEMMEAFNIPVYSAAGFEADDVIGTLSEQASAQGIDTHIVTMDSDIVQLIRDNVWIYMLRPYQRDHVIYDAVAAQERYGFPPERMMDYKALIGDTSDNIPGVPGIGPKTAVGLLTSYGSIEGIYDNVDAIKQDKLRNSLKEYEGQVRFAKEMATIRLDVPDITLEMEEAQVGRYDRQRVLDLLRDLEFRTLVPRLPAVDDDIGPTVVPEPPAETSYTLINTEDALNDVVERLREAGRFAYDLELVGSSPYHSLLVGVAVSPAVGEAYYMPTGHVMSLGGPDQLEGDMVLEKMAPLFGDAAIEKVAHNGKFDIAYLEERGIKCTGFAFDTLLAAYLLGDGALGDSGRSGAGSMSLKWLVSRRMNFEMREIIDLIGKAGVKQQQMDQTLIDQAMHYTCENVDCTLRLAEHLEGELKKLDMWELFAGMEMPLVPVLARMEEAGIAMDTNVLREMSVDLNEQIAYLETKAYSDVGHQFNLGSPPQLSAVLFEELGLPKTRKTKQGYSTDAQSIEGLREAHPIIDTILRWREMTKLRSTYIEALPGAVDPKDRRIHTTFDQAVAATGRLSSNNPNLQNIPVRSELGGQVRRAFVARDFGDEPYLLSADYSQIELRILAHMSQDPSLLKAFWEDEDIHRATAAQVFGMALEDVTREQRNRAKVFNFGVLYGLTDFGLAQREGISREEAGAFIKRYFEKYDAVRRWRDDIVNQTRADGYAETLAGRRRYIPDIHSGNFNVRMGAERIAINMPVQGTASDIIKIAMIRIDDELSKRKLMTRMLLQVHDELIFEGPHAELEELRGLVKEIMPASLKLDVPLKVDVKIGRNWADMESA